MKQDSNDLEQGVPTTQSQSVYSRIREDILNISLEPGIKLKTRQLCDRYQVGLTPLREALNRLASEGMVVQTERRGFTVASFSMSDLDEIVRTKKWVNEIGLRQSILHGDAEWEEQVVLSFHRLLRTPRFSAGDPHEVNRNVDWNSAHYAFHSSLLSACRSSWLIGFCEKLFYASDRYRAVSRLIPDAPMREEEHRKIMEATINRDADNAVAMLCAHFDVTAANVRASLGESESRDATD